MAGMRGIALCSQTLAPGARSARRRCTHSVANIVASATNLRSWVKSEGGFVWSGLHVVHSGYSQGMELLATQDLPQGSTIIALPRKIPLGMPDPNPGVPLSPTDAVLCQLAARIPEELWALRLGLKLLSERAQKGSYWWPYISMLPQTFTLPIFFPGSDIENIDYIPVTYQVKKRCKFLLQLASEMSGLDRLPEDRHPYEGQSVDAAALGWAMAAVSSRAFRIHGVKNKLCSAMLLPLIDMCNHSLNPNARIVEDLTKEAQDVSFLKVVTENDLKKGTPVTINYGQLSNDMLLLDYGFVIPDNPHDRVELRYDGALMENARLLAGFGQSQSNSQPFTNPAPWQLVLLKQLGLSDPGESQKVTLGGPEHVDGRLLAALRILYAEEGVESIKDLTVLQSWDVASMLGNENEEKVLRTLCALGAIVFNQFKTTIEEDEAKLADKGLAETSRIAIQFRLTKKKVVRRVLDSLKTKLLDLKRIQAS